MAVESIIAERHPVPVLCCKKKQRPQKGSLHQARKEVSPRERLVFPPARMNPPSIYSYGYNASVKLACTADWKLRGFEANQGDYSRSRYERRSAIRSAKSSSSRATLA